MSTEKNREQNQDKNPKTEDIVKITISREAEEKLSEVLAEVNNGFDAGRVNRQQLATWALIRFGQDCTEDMIRSIRADHFDEIALLESILRRGKHTGELPQELKSALRTHLKSTSAPRKQSKKSLTDTYINDVNLKNEHIAHETK